MRNIVIEKIHSLMKKNDKIFFLTADMGINLVEIFGKDFPKRYLNVGIAEQNLISISAGLANLGYIPVAYTISNFLIHRCYEQLRNDIVLHNYPIILIGTSSGYDNAPLGPTHHIVDDWGHLINFENFEIFSPISNKFAINKIEEVFKKPRPCFFRLAKGDFSDLNVKEDFYFSRKSKKDKTLFISYGNLSKTLLKLNNQNKKNILLLNKIHPLTDDVTIIQTLKKFRKLIIVEDHFSISGLYSLFCQMKNKYSLKQDILSISPQKYDLKVGRTKEFYLKKNKLDYKSLIKIK